MASRSHDRASELRSGPISAKSSSSRARGARIDGNWTRASPRRKSFCCPDPCLRRRSRWRWDSLSRATCVVCSRTWSAFPRVHGYVSVARSAGARPI